MLLKRTRCPETSLKATLWMKAQHEGALTPPCIVRKNPQVPHSAQQVACHSVNNSKGKGKSIPPRKTRRDSLVRTRRVLCDPSQKWTPHTSAASQHPGLPACRSRSRVSAVLTDMNHGFAQPAPPTSRHKQHLPPQGKNREGRDLGGHPDQTFHLQRSKLRVREI